MQTSNLPSYTSPINSNGANVELGRQAGFNRYFNGEMDDLRISSDALYLNNFTPPCPDLSAGVSTVSLWNLNENTGTTINDSGPNNYIGQIFGTIWDTATICLTTNIDLAKNETLKVYPNPSNGKVYFQNFDLNESDLKLIIYNSYGQIIIKEELTSNLFLIDLKNKASGIYHFRIQNDKNILYSGRITKK